MGKSTWDLQKHIDELREWGTSIITIKVLPLSNPDSLYHKGTLWTLNKKKSTAVRTQNLPKLTPQICDELRKKGACFRCRKPGHMSRECPGPDSTISTSSSRRLLVKGRIEERLWKKLTKKG